MVPRPIVPLSGGSSHAAAGPQPIAIAPASIRHMCFMRTSMIARAGAVGPAPALVPTSPRSPRRIGAHVSVDDFAAGREPGALLLLHLGERALEIFDAQRLPGDHRMQRNAHDPRLLSAVGEELLELIHHRAVVLLAGIALAQEQPDVVDLHAIGNGEHFSAL